MPELPDLEVFAANLQRSIGGKKLQRVIAAAPVSKTGIKKLEGKTLKKVYREGKELRFLFSSKDIMGIHLMLRGKLSWIDDDDKDRHTLAEFHFSNKKKLGLSDYQRRATIKLNPAVSEVPDALSREITTAFLSEQLQSNAAIKNLLLDQHIIRGIGNAYADEILWKAGISPFSKSNKIPRAKINALAKAIRSVLKKAIVQIKKAEPGIIGGEIRDFLAIHNAKKKTSPGGRPIKKKDAGRPTYFTDEQVLYK